MGKSKNTWFWEPNQRFGMRGGKLASPLSPRYAMPDSPFCRLRDIFPRPGEVFPQRESPWHDGKVSGQTAKLAGALAPTWGAVAQRLRGFQSAEHKKSFSEATWIFCMEPNSFGVTRGEQPLVRASRASKVAGAFLVLFWHAKENVPGGNALAKGMKL